jgi:cell filamentation protein
MISLRSGRKNIQALPCFRTVGFLSDIERSVVKDIEIKVFLKPALTDKIHDRTLFMRGIDVSYYYEGYSKFRIEEL